VIPKRRAEFNAVFGRNSSCTKHPPGEDSQAQRNVPIAILIILLKHVCHTLEADARLHEQIETQRPPAPSVVRREQQPHVFRRETVAEGHQGVREFREADVARAVDVEAVEEFAPFGEEAPEAAVVAKNGGVSWVMWGAEEVERGDY